MRLVRLIPALAVLFFSGAAAAQSWDEYSNRENFFSINLPAEPKAAETQYKTAKGTNLTAHVFTAVAPAGSRLAGTYRITVVDYSKAKDEIPMALEEARQAMRAKGTVKYDGINNIDLHLSRRLTVETGSTRILSEIVMAANDRLYITEAETPLNVPPPAVFQASLQILDDNGVRIRTRTNLGVPEGVVSPIGAGGIVNDPDRIAAQVAGSWHKAGGACEAAFFKSGMRAKTKRGEEALAGTVTNAGMSFTGELILEGSRLGQFINPMTDQALMLFDPQDGTTLSVSGLNGPAASLGEVNLELCPNSRG
jgi:hypothetical protein